tara:strand:- start:89 stop:856 length:768 start_codon:yes stop_codon:yes gene_type:complete
MPKKKTEDAPTNQTGGIVGLAHDEPTWRGKKKKKKKVKYEGANMKQFHDLWDDGKTPEEIAKIMKLDLATVKALMEDRNYRKEYDNYHKQPEQRERNAGRLRARRLMVKMNKVKPFDKKDVHHKDNDPTNNDKKNLSVTTQKYNRSEPRKRLKETDTVAVKPILPDSTFASMPVFRVSATDFARCKFGKQKFTRWARHIDTDTKTGQKIYNYAKANPTKSIILQHGTTGHMLYLRKYAKKDGTKSGIMVKKGTKK